MSPPSSSSNGTHTPPPPPHRASPLPNIPTEPSHHYRGNQTHPPIVPYSVTTITPNIDSISSPPHTSTNEMRRSESPRHPVAMAPIPPPSILQRSNDVPQSDPTPSSGVYYSIPEDSGRTLNEEGQFISSTGSGRVSRGSGRGSVVVSEPDEAIVVLFGGDEEEEVLKKVTAVVKAVMELSNRVSFSSPDHYLELVKVNRSHDYIANHMTHCLYVGCWHGDERVTTYSGYY